MGKVITLHLSVHLFSEVPTLAGGTFPGFGGLTGGSPFSSLRVPILARGTYPDLGTYLSWGTYPWLLSNVKLSKRCQVVKKLSNVKKSNIWTMEEVHTKNELT